MGIFFRTQNPESSDITFDMDFLQVQLPSYTSCTCGVSAKQKQRFCVKRSIRRAMHAVKDVNCYQVLMRFCTQEEES
jgi:hypothetical protein